MRTSSQAILSALFCALIGGAVVLVFRATPPEPGIRAAAADVVAPVIDKDKIEDAGFGMALHYMEPIRDPGSLRDIGERVRARGKAGLAATRAALESLRPGPGMAPDQARQAGLLLYQLGLLEMYEGEYRAATASFEQALEVGRVAGIPPQVRSRLTALLGIVALRQGEVDNCIACVGPSSCIFPIAPEAVHQNREGSRQAVRRFTEYLDESPGDLRVRWLLNIAYMTLGEYPDRVPPRQRIPLDRFASKLDIGRFENVAPLVGLTGRGPNLAGGSVFDDFDGDGLPDIFATSLDADRGASLWLNKGDGTFDDRSDSAGAPRPALRPERPGRRLRQRRRPRRRPVARRLGAADAALAAAEPGGRHLRRRDDDRRPRRADPDPESAAWGDYDGDGRLDLFVGGEYLPAYGPTCAAGPRPAQPMPALSQPRRRHVRRCRGAGRRHQRSLRQGRRPGATTTATAGSTSTSRT